MKKGYDLKMRERAVDLVVKQKKSIKATSEIFQVHYQTVRNWVECYKQTGKVTSGRKPVVKPYKLDWEALRKDVEENPSAYLAERAKKFGVAIATIWEALKKMGIRYKKKLYLPGTKPRAETRIPSGTREARASPDSVPRRNRDKSEDN